MDESLNNRRWTEILSLLTTTSSMPDTSDVPSRSTTSVRLVKPLGSIRKTTRVEILERLSPTSVVLCLVDATSGRYSGQIWTMRTAVKKGVCSVSMMPFVRGDQVYRRSTRGDNLVRENQSILAGAIAALEAGQNFLAQC
jgi:hypothetical protein